MAHKVGPAASIEEPTAKGKHKHGRIADEVIDSLEFLGELALLFFGNIGGAAQALAIGDDTHLAFGITGYVRNEIQRAYTDGQQQVNGGDHEKEADGANPGDDMPGPILFSQLAGLEQEGFDGTKNRAIHMGELMDEIVKEVRQGWVTAFVFGLAACRAEGAIKNAATIQTRFYPH